MLKTQVIHPIILEALAAAGHGGKVLIADGDYPVSTTKGIHAQIVYLNLVPGQMAATEVLDALQKILPIEKAQVMEVPEGHEKPEIWAIYKEMLKDERESVEFTSLERFAFYAEVANPDTALIIQTGEIRDYANLLLTIGSLW